MSFEKPIDEENYYLNYLCRRCESDLDSLLSVGSSSSIIRNNSFAFTKINSQENAVNAKQMLPLIEAHHAKPITDAKFSNESAVISNQNGIKSASLLEKEFSFLKNAISSQNICCNKNKNNTNLKVQPIFTPEKNQSSIETPFNSKFLDYTYYMSNAIKSNEILRHTKVQRDCNNDKEMKCNEVQNHKDLNIKEIFTSEVDKNELNNIVERTYQALNNQTNKDTIENSKDIQIYSNNQKINAKHNGFDMRKELKMPLIEKLNYFSNKNFKNKTSKQSINILKIVNQLSNISSDINVIQRNLLRSYYSERAQDKRQYNELSLMSDVQHKKKDIKSKVNLDPLMYSYNPFRSKKLEENSITKKT